MKKIFFLSVIVVAAFITIFVGCNKDVEGRTENIAALQPVNIDLNAGTWKPVLLTAPDEFAVPAPSATTTPDYIAQVNEIKSFQVLGFVVLNPAICHAFPFSPPPRG